MLEGFTTDLPHIVAHFRHEQEMCLSAVDQEQHENFPELFKTQVFDLFQEFDLEEQLRNSLDSLMKKADLTFY